MNIVSDIVCYQGYTLYVYTTFWNLHPIPSTATKGKGSCSFKSVKKVALFEMDPQAACRALLANCFFMVACIAYFSALKAEEVISLKRI